MTGLFIATQSKDFNHPWASQIYAVAATIDTVKVLGRQRDKALQRALRAAGAHVKPRPRKAPDGNTWWWPEHITRPSLAVFKVLADFPHLKWNRVDIAYDFTFADSASAKSFFNWCAASITLRRAHKTTQRRWKETSLYFKDTLGKSLPARAAILYKKSATKIRLELRFQNSTAVKANGLNDLTHKTLKHVDPAHLFAKHFKITEIDPKFLAKQIKWHTKRHDASQWSHQTMAHHWRMNLPYRIAGLYRRVFMYAKADKCLCKPARSWCEIPQHLLT